MARRKKTAAAAGAGADAGAERVGAESAAGDEKEKTRKTNAGNTTTRRRKTNAGRKKADEKTTLPEPKRFYTLKTEKRYDQALEQVGHYALQSRAPGVALQVLRDRAVLNGLKVAGEAAQDKNEDDPFEGMSDEEAERELARRLVEYQKLTGRDLAAHGPARDGSAT